MNGGKIRNDSWAASLDEAQSWDLYYKSLQPGVWNKVAEFAVKEYGVKMPSQSAFYRWQRFMHAKEHEHRMEQAAIAAAEAAALGKQATKDESIIQALKALATEAALRSDAKTANSLIQSACAIKDRLQRAEEIRQKDRSQGTKDERLRLEREKFEAAERRLAAVKDAVKDPNLTPEKLREELDRMFGKA